MRREFVPNASTVNGYRVGPKGWLVVWFAVCGTRTYAVGWTEEVWE
jgi:hypothetical protein